MAALALSSLETMLNSLMGNSGGEDNNKLVVNDDDALDSPPPPPLPARPTPRCRRHPSRLHNIVTIRDSTHKEEEEDEGKKVDDVLVEELEKKAAMAEARLRQKEEENSVLRRKIESYHVRWLQYEIELSSLKETIDEQMASLQMAQESSAENRPRKMLPSSHDDRRREYSESHMKMSDESRSRKTLPSYDDRRDEEFAESHMKMSEEMSARLRRHGGGRGVDAVVVRRNPAPWQPRAPGGNSIDDLKKLKSEFRSWKKDYKARLRKAAAVEIDCERRGRNNCW
uniref:Uncharacterized protein n=1 Tax=Leersia perrieri TaxID=77586 RepID=A0A0D9VCG4_9ORYZ